MSKITKEQLAQLKEDSKIQKAGVRLPVLDRIMLNGDAEPVENDKGELVRPEVTYRKTLFTKAEPDTRPERVEIGKEVEVIFIRVRRKLVERDDNGRQKRATTQHGHYKQVVALWENGQLIETNNADKLREKYEGLRTIQEVYALLDGELVLLVVKGASLGSKSRDAKYPTFYKYIESIAEEGIFMHTTKLGGALEEGKKKYYTMTFKKGRKTTDEELAQVFEHSEVLKKIHKDYDEANSKKEETTTETTEDEEVTEEVQNAELDF